jgi:hypothetical protein
MGSNHICHVCHRTYTTRPLLVRHVGQAHRELIPDNTSVGQFVFDNARGNRGRRHVCVICKTKPVPWNETTGRYDRFCSTRCRERARDLAQANLKKVYGNKNLMLDTEHQQKMQYARGISGVYKFSDGVEIRYMGTYELDFLRVYDTELGLRSDDIVECPHHFRYVFDGKPHAYIPDYYIPSLDLIIEIKDGTNKAAHIEEDRKKDELKEEAVRKNSAHHFIKIVEKDYGPFVELLDELRNE